LEDEELALLDLGFGVGADILGEAAGQSSLTTIADIG
jgi:hypothetical protein